MPLVLELLHATPHRHLHHLQTGDVNLLDQAEDGGEDVGVLKYKVCVKTCVMGDLTLLRVLVMPAACLPRSGGWCLLIEADDGGLNSDDDDASDDLNRDDGCLYSLITLRVSSLLLENW